MPAYTGGELCQVGTLEGKPLEGLHGRKVFAWVVPHRSRRDGQGGSGKLVTHIAVSQRELEAGTPRTRPAGRKGAGTSAKPPHPKAKLVSGWLSVTGHSIATKRYERLFIDDPGEQVPITSEHERFWRSVLQAYEFAAKYHDPQATYQKTSKQSRPIERSLHVRKSDELRDLPDGTLVYVKFDPERREVTEVHPVMIGRLPFAASPGELLHESLKPAQKLPQLSPRGPPLRMGVRGPIRWCPWPRRRRLCRYPRRIRIPWPTAGPVDHLHHLRLAAPHFPEGRGDTRTAERP